MQSHKQFEYQSIPLNCWAVGNMIRLLKYRGYIQSKKDSDVMLVRGSYRKNRDLGVLEWRLSRHDCWQKSTHPDGYTVQDLRYYFRYLEERVLKLKDHPPQFVPYKDRERLERFYRRNPDIIRKSVLDRPCGIRTGSFGVEGYEYDDDQDFLQHIHVEQAYARKGMGLVGRTGKETLSDLSRVRESLRVRRVG